MSGITSLWPMVLSYLLGAVPFGLLVARGFGVPDIRALGSRNIGATNVWRVIGPKAAVWVYVLDIGKGAVAVPLARVVDQDLMPRELFFTLCGLAAVIGHIFPVYLKFRGGKGVNTALGVMVTLLPLETAICLILFLATVALTRYISLGSMLGATGLAAVLLIERFALHRELSLIYVGLGLVMMVIVVLAHRSNIRRLVDGTENRFSFTSPTRESGSHG
ncbi:MAG: glycerol-3-phosphate 1-O-acyltransferase PlsY [Candidatus Zixiibacteriota bacterium]